VLLVEDEPAARSGLCDVLEMLGYKTVAVEDAEQALALSPSPAFDVLITDLMLPGLSGAALAEQLLVRWPDLGVIVISGYSEDRTAELAHHLESARFMHKPFSMAELSHEIRTTLDER
jgi:DNA-binding response OmpR family regulator